MRRVVNLRTDADSEPCLEMRQAMVEAPMGLDLVGEDPATNELEEKTAALLGKEAGVFVPTGIMADLIPIMTSCNKGDEVILGDKCHVIANECGGAAGIVGAMVRTVPNDERGMMDPKAVEAAIRPVLPPPFDNYPRTKLICIENTQNRCGGTVLTLEDHRQIAEVAHSHGVPVWCDGARFINAAKYLGVSLAELAKDLDAVSFGFMKSMGVYTGSVICGTTDFINRARRNRYVLGGQLPMSGFIAAACLWALEHSMDRITEDHANARVLAEAIANMDGLSIDLKTVQTNIVLFKVNCMSPAEYAAKLNKNGVLCWTFPGGIRMVTDNTINRSDIDYAIEIMNRALVD